MVIISGDSSCIREPLVYICHNVSPLVVTYIRRWIGIPLDRGDIFTIAAAPESAAF
jgi:hypothetical protein